MRAEAKLIRVIETLSKWTGKSVAFLIFILAVVIFYEIIMRYVFASPTLWGHELSAMIFGTFAVIGGAYTMYKGGHVNMDLVLLRLPVRIKAAAEIFGALMAFAFLGVLVWKGGEIAIKSISMFERASTLWGPPIWPMKLILPLGSLIFLLQVAVKLFRDINTLIAGRKES